MQVAMRRPCQHCGSDRTGQHGTFLRRDGARLQRWLCRACGRTFSPNTGTAMHYIKKHRQWAQLAPAMAQRLSVRRMGAVLGIRPATAFRWRHRVLARLEGQPQPPLTGPAAACEAYVPYSEKGSRCTDGPGAWGRRRAANRPAARESLRAGGQESLPHRAPRPQGARPFRRLVDGLPSCVLLACALGEQALVIVGRGRPVPAELQTALTSVLGAGAKLWGRGLAPYAEACRPLGVPYQDGACPPGDGESVRICRAVDHLYGQFHRWLRHFHGVATRYLSHYVAWFAAVRRATGLQYAA